MTAGLTAVKRGYAFVEPNERGHFFWEGNYDILGAPTTDGYDRLDWIAKQRQGRRGAPLHAIPVTGHDRS